MENVFTREGDDNKAEYRCGDLYEGCIRWKHCSLDLNNRENFLFSNSVYKSFCTNSRYFKYKYILLVNSINSERIRNTPLKDRFDSACKPDRIRSLPNRPELVCSDNPTYHDPARIFPIYPECIIPRIFDFFRFFFPPFFPQCLLSYISSIYLYLSFNDRSDEHSRFIYEVAIWRCFITHVFWPMRIRWPADEYLTIGLFTVLIDDAQSTLLLRLMARFGWLRVTELPVGRSEIVTQGMLFRSSIGEVRLICLEICDFGRLFKSWITLRWLLDCGQF